MQQTEKYQLNLIEKTDAFSPDPVNENTKKLDTALAALQDSLRDEVAAREKADAALDARVTALEVKKIVFGSYTGSATKTGDTQFIPLDFTPVAVIVSDQIALQGQPSKDIKLGENGFTAIANMYSTLNQHDVNYNFIAFG